jgi:ATP-dependent Clp protease ATP-binding subunit ClpB
MMKELQSRLKEQDIEITISDSAKEFIAVNGFDPIYGARPLKRFIQRNIETKLARAIIAGKVIDHSVVSVTIENEELTISIG